MEIELKLDHHSWLATCGGSACFQDWCNHFVYTPYQAYKIYRATKNKNISLEFNS